MLEICKFIFQNNMSPIGIVKLETQDIFRKQDACFTQPNSTHKALSRPQRSHANSRITGVKAVDVEMLNVLLAGVMKVARCLTEEKHAFVPQILDC